MFGIAIYGELNDKYFCSYSLSLCSEDDSKEKWGKVGGHSGEVYHKKICFTHRTGQMGAFQKLYSWCFWESVLQIIFSSKINEVSIPWLLLLGKPVIMLQTWQQFKATTVLWIHLNRWKIRRQQKALLFICSVF